MFELTVATNPGLSVRTFVVHESLSEAFRIEVMARCTDASLELGSVVGLPASFTLTSEVAEATYLKRTWTGICQSVTLERAEPTGHSTYRFHLVPALWLLSQRRNYRVFVHMSAPELVKQLFDEWTLDTAVALDIGDYPKLPYKVQYGESDLDFVSRVLEEAGIVLAFIPDETGTARLTLADRLESGAPRALAIPFADDASALERKEFVTDVRIAERVRTGSRVVTDFDMRRPRQTVSQSTGPVAGPESRLEHYEYRPGGFLVDVDADGSSPVADDGGAARHDDGAGQSLVQRGLDALRGDRWIVQYRTNALDAWPGRLLRIAQHTHGTLEESKTLLVTEATLEGVEGEAWGGRVKAVSAGVPYRPPARVRRPRARIQSATVVGKPPIDTDEFGRVKVRFPWDRGASPSSTLWVRVSQGWGGGGFGFIKHPRVGEEVLVDFLEGDPEQPLVVGRLFNLANPVINALPDNATQTAWMSNSTGSAGGNEILFEDKKGQELLYGQAAKDVRRLVNHDDTSTIVHDRSKSVSVDELETTQGTRTQVTTGDRSETSSVDRTTAVLKSFGELVKKTENDIVEGARLVTIGVDQHVITQGAKREQSTSDTSLIVEGNRKESVAGTDSLGVVGSLVSVVGSYTVSASGPEGTIHLFAGGPIVIESSTDVTLKGAGGFVKVDAGSAVVKGTLVVINESGSPGSLPAASPSAPDPPTPAGMTPDPPPPGAS